MTNVQRHSESPSVDVRLSRVNGTVTLFIGDQGRGIPAEVLQARVENWAGSLGVGLRGMSERLRQLGGELQVSSDKTGTQVRATVPVKEHVKETVSAVSPSV